jgi:hypothetical protein
MGDEMVDAVGRGKPRISFLSMAKQPDLQHGTVQWKYTNKSLRFTLLLVHV